MSRKLIVTVAFEDSLKQQIRAAVQARGFEALFFENDSQALPFLADAEILLSQSPRLAQSAPALRWQCTPSAGVDHFIGAEAFESRVLLTNSSGAYGVTISEHILMVILELLRRQQEYAATVARREWQRGLAIRSIRDSRAVLLGTGDIGQETARRLRAFGPSSLTGVNRGGGNPEGLFDRALTQDRIDEALPEADLLIVSLPGTAEARRMLDARRLALLPDGAVVVNVGRGSVIDQRALEKELRSGRLYAALDVFEREPLPADDPLWDCPHLLLTPHVAGNMTLPYTRQRIAALFLEDFARYCEGEPLRRLVDLNKGY